MTSSASLPPDPQTAFHRLLWAPENSLATWATEAACAVLDLLPVGIERGGYRHDIERDDAGVTTHELVELESSLAVCLIYEHRDGSRVVGFCQPWPAILLRFITAVLDGDLLGADVLSASPAVPIGGR